MDNIGQWCGEWLGFGGWGHLGHSEGAIYSLGSQFSHIENKGCHEVHTHNPSSQDAGAGRLSLSPAWATEQNSFSKIKLNLGVVAHTCIPRAQRSETEGSKVQGQPGGGVTGLWTSLCDFPVYKLGEVMPPPFSLQNLDSRGNIPEATAHPKPILL